MLFIDISDSLNFFSKEKCIKTSLALQRKSEKIDCQIFPTKMIVQSLCCRPVIPVLGGKATPFGWNGTKKHIMESVFSKSNLVFFAFHFFFCLFSFPLFPCSFLPITVCLVEILACLLLSSNGASKTKQIFLFDLNFHPDDLHPI